MIRGTISQDCDRDDTAKNSAGPIIGLDKLRGGGKDSFKQPLYLLCHPQQGNKGMLGPVPSALPHTWQHGGWRLQG